ncbi:16S rRNA (guanine(966)-N(2))-methyltransferase RsmD [Pseudomonas abyssi]|jgi:16S rRNA (guanine966-N2)-methyltransferase|uniref:Ribosomal RNA small subunit methyltransferase D n=2 Tax=Pseudomonas abyssi TaxID=170540 RepID=A0A2A3MCW1_9PSED|nr:MULTISPECIES: 16S rRNA (guanine(966)-N(2))-methyltransferase RsmD [Pseudomonadaceae]MAD01969.1 16S rRNA (guanine(966)-N(2))-methyltransferase RsmD [Pseudomonadales bacterium]MAG66187.1 16S rRNA (guanine(966)-N(2))-methyltransferase RsmD [Pseudomonadales bacterium]PBK02602.1 16S rRNA (guanine(966)-N(2))-methyltransferase RsmD [Pseudomonas abyssi]RGP52840.1 16S rRNA (guanine(966)-N(2))-methyltransferase RsmD [Halopseudomonas gallaeciensis]|tara:strand:+ start:10919 stop:11500 length:582 start_codon:yes stop_codon:yes gene_type:complete
MKPVRTKARVSQLRIIAGEWRSRRFSFTEQPGLRPTPDRVRETLFNWLSSAVPGAHCLDPFTGSGALTLEALSRGAASALAGDLSRDVVQTLRGHLQTLECDRAEVVQQDGLSLLSGTPPRQFDLVFLDPPFHQGLLEPACSALEANGWLADDAQIYIESEQSPSQLTLPGSWQLHREKRAGQVWYSLWHRAA